MIDQDGLKNEKHFKFMKLEDLKYIHEQIKEIKKMKYEQFQDKEV